MAVGDNIWCDGEPERILSSGATIGEPLWSDGMPVVVHEYSASVGGTPIPVIMYHRRQQGL